jgi:hypothetical protein
MWWPLSSRFLLQDGWSESSVKDLVVPANFDADAHLASKKQFCAFRHKACDKGFYKEGTGAPTRVALFDAIKVRWLCGSLWCVTVHACVVVVGAQVWVWVCSLTLPCGPQEHYKPCLSLGSCRRDLAARSEHNVPAAGEYQAGAKKRAPPGGLKFATSSVMTFSPFKFSFAVENSFANG